VPACGVVAALRNEVATCSVPVPCIGLFGGVGCGGVGCVGCVTLCVPSARCLELEVLKLQCLRVRLSHVPQA
jgi:hypothetical protein